MKAFIAGCVAYVVGLVSFYGVLQGFWSLDALLWVFFPIMVVSCVYGLARASTGHPRSGKWFPRCAKTGRWLPQDSSKWDLTKPKKLGHPPRRLEHAVISHQPSPYSD
jgi:hypothetical protein